MFRHLLVLSVVLAAGALDPVLQYPDFLDWTVPNNVSDGCMSATTVQVPMPHTGGALNTIVRVPETSGKKVGTVLILTPYGAAAQSIGTLNYCMRGFATVVQDDRGSGKSPGKFDLFHHSGADGYDTVEWITKQPWSNGKVATTGGSALGIAQMNMLINRHPEPHKALKAVNPIVAHAEEHQMNMQGGAYRQALLNGWLAAQGDSFLIPQAKAHEGWDNAYFQNTSGWSSTSDGVTGFDRARRHGAWGVHMAGWYDIFSTTMLETVRELNDTSLGGAPQWLIVEPTGHCQGGAVAWPNASWGGKVMNDVVNSLYDLRIGDPSPAQEKELLSTLNAVPRLTYYVTGPGTTGSTGNFWVQGQAWPKATEVSFYLGQGGTLSNTVPGVSNSTFVYDPTHPVPTHGGNNLMIHPCGPQDQRKVDNDRTDVVVYSQTDPLSAPLAVVGNVTLDLRVGSNASDTDFVVKLVDVWPDGTRMLVQDGIRRMRWRGGPWAPEPSAPMNPDIMYDALVVVGGVSHVFNAGHKVGLTVTSSNSPRFMPNPNTGEPLSQNSSRTVLARNTVYHGCAGPDRDCSRLNLPTVDLKVLLREPAASYQVV